MSFLLASREERQAKANIRTASKAMLLEKIEYVLERRGKSMETELGFEKRYAPAAGTMEDPKLSISTVWDRGKPRRIEVSYGSEIELVAETVRLRNGKMRTEITYSSPLGLWSSAIDCSHIETKRQQKADDIFSLRRSVLRSTN